jgi:hypothetical protein
MSNPLFRASSKALQTNNFAAIFEVQEFLQQGIVERLAKDFVVDEYDVCAAQDGVDGGRVEKVTGEEMYGA